MVDSTTDVIQETSTLSTEIDTVHSSVTFSLTTTSLANMENLTLIGTTAINGIGNARNNVLTGNSANNSLSGGTGNDILDGGAGIDTLNGGSGNDTLSGGAGGDFFRFDSALSGTTNVDRVTDFSIADNDRIQLENTGTGLFTAITATGTLALTAFVIGTAFTNTVQRIRYDSNIGNLFYDSDGSGSAASILFCTLSGGLGLTNNQFQVT
jgi:Ca2+-binding RTX toxin-like protein